MVAPTSDWSDGRGRGLRSTPCTWRGPGSADGAGFGGDALVLKDGQVEERRQLRRRRTIEPLSRCGRATAGPPSDDSMLAEGMLTCTWQAGGRAGGSRPSRESSIAWVGAEHREGRRRTGHRRLPGPGAAPPRGYYPPGGGRRQRRPSSTLPPRRAWPSPATGTVVVEETLRIISPSPAVGQDRQQLVHGCTRRRAARGPVVVETVAQTGRRSAMAERPAAVRHCIFESGSPPTMTSRSGRARSAALRKRVQRCRPTTWSWKPVSEEIIAASPGSAERTAPVHREEWSPAAAAARPRPRPRRRRPRARAWVNSAERAGQAPRRPAPGSLRDHLQAGLGSGAAMPSPPSNMIRLEPRRRKPATAPWWRYHRLVRQGEPELPQRPREMRGRADRPSVKTMKRQPRSAAERRPSGAGSRSPRPCLSLSTSVPSMSKTKPRTRAVAVLDQVARHRPA